jgi:hypothetical protein
LKLREGFVFAGLADDLDDFLGVDFRIFWLLYPDELREPDSSNPRLFRIVPPAIGAMAFRTHESHARPRDFATF